MTRETPYAVEKRDQSLRLRLPSTFSGRSSSSPDHALRLRACACRTMINGLLSKAEDAKVSSRSLSCG